MGELVVTVMAKVGDTGNLRHLPQQDTILEL